MQRLKGGGGGRFQRNAKKERRNNRCRVLLLHERGSDSICGENRVRNFGFSFFFVDRFHSKAGRDKCNLSFFKYFLANLHKTRPSVLIAVSSFLSGLLQMLVFFFLVCFSSSNFLIFLDYSTVFTVIQIHLKYNNTSLKAIGGKEWKREDSLKCTYFSSPLSSAVMIPKELSCCKEEAAPLKKLELWPGAAYFSTVYNTLFGVHPVREALQK